MTIFRKCSHWEQLNNNCDQLQQNIHAMNTPNEYTNRKWKFNVLNRNIILVVISFRLSLGNRSQKNILHFWFGMQSISVCKNKRHTIFGMVTKPLCGRPHTLNLQLQIFFERFDFLHSIFRRYRVSLAHSISNFDSFDVFGWENMQTHSTMALCTWNDGTRRLNIE